MRSLRMLGPSAAVLTSLTLLATGSTAAPLAPRLTMGVQGGVQVVGNTLGWDCGSGLTPPAGTTVNCTGAFTDANSSPDVYWQDNNAGPLVLPQNARSSAKLTLPAGATVVAARLYWGARDVALLKAGTCKLEKVGAAQALTVMNATTSSVFTNFNQEYWYQSTADVTTYVAAQGAGEYRVNNIDAIVLPNTTQLPERLVYAAWGLVVVYSAPSSAFAQVSLYDGFVYVDGTTMSSSDTPVTFALPKSPKRKVTLATLAYGGDAFTKGDSLSWNGTPVSDTQNAVDNIFNSSRTALGAPVSDAMDQPPLSGSSKSMASFDLDAFDVSSLVQPADTSAVVNVSVKPVGGAAADHVFLGAMVTEIRGCTVGSDCTDAAKPVCNLATGDCQVCVGGPTPVGCVSAPGGPVCIANGVDSFCGCTVDADCGGPTSGKVCNAATQQCQNGCRGMNGNGCMPGFTCTSTDGTIGVCSPCLSNADCTNPAAPHCNTSTGQCGPCIANSDCTSPAAPHCNTTTGQCGPCASDGDCTDPALPHCNTGTGHCVQCVSDPQCPMGDICDPSTNTCGPDGGTSSSSTSGAGGASTGSTSGAGGAGAGGASTGSTSGAGGAGAGGASTGSTSGAGGTGAGGATTGSAAGGGGHGGTSTGGTGPNTFGVLVEGGGCACSVQSRSAGETWFSAGAAALAALFLRRRRRAR